MKRALLVAALFALAGCGIDHIRVLREAEQTFSRAAEQENLGRFDSQRSGALPGGVTDITGYRIAAEMTAKLISEKEAELKQDNLLCTAYVIRAFSLWRLGEFAKASAAAEKPCGDANATPRDRVLLGVLPALVKIDESYARVFNDKKNEHEEIASDIQSAIATLTQGDAKLPRDHPLRAYLFAARLAALRVAHVAPNREGLTGDREADISDAVVKRATDMIMEYRSYLNCQVGLANHPSVAYWHSLFGIPFDPNLNINCRQ